MSYSREEVKAITDKVLNMAKADAVEVALLRRRAVGDALRQLDASPPTSIEHDQEVHDHGPLRPEVGDRRRRTSSTMRR